MTAKKRLKLIFVFAVAVMVMFLASCSIGMDSLDDILAKNDLTAQITYYSNGGWFNSEGIVSRDIYYKKDAKGYEITSSTPNVNVKRTDYIYDGWYLIETREIDGEKYFVCNIPDGENTDVYFYLKDGQQINCIEYISGEYLIKIADYQQIISTSNIPLLTLGEKYNFSNRLQDNDHFYVAAKWLADQCLEYILLTEDGVEGFDVVVDGQTVSYKNGDVIKEEAYDIENSVKRPMLDPIDTGKVATFVEYYKLDENGDYIVAFDGPEMKPEGNENGRVYAKYVLGEWNIVKDADSVKDLFISPADNHYVINDIDCSDITVNRVSGSFKGTVKGNGHTISNLTVNALRIKSGEKAGLFGTLSEEARFENIRFANISFKCTTSSQLSGTSFVDIYLLAHTLNGRPSFENVCFDVVTLDIVQLDNVIINNIQKLNDGYDVSNWLCGGYDDNQSAMASLTGVSLNACKLVIKDRSGTVLTEDEIESAQ